MGNDFQSLDILLFALIAVFLAIRLRNTLGRGMKMIVAKKTVLILKELKMKKTKTLL